MLEWYDVTTACRAHWELLLREADEERAARAVASEQSRLWHGRAATALVALARRLAPEGVAGVAPRDAPLTTTTGH